MMKKVGVALMLGSKTRCRWRKKGLKTIIVRGKLPAGEATKAPPLGSTLGLYGVKADDFCTFYNKDSLRFYEEGVIIPFVVLISSTKAYIVEYKLPSVYTYITEFYSRFLFRVGPLKVFSRGKKRRKLSRYSARKRGRIAAFRDIFWASGQRGSKLVTRRKSIAYFYTRRKSIEYKNVASILTEFSKKSGKERRVKVRKKRKWRKGRDRSRRQVRMNMTIFREALYMISWMKSSRKETYFLKKWFLQILGSYNSCNFFDTKRFIKIDKWAFKKGGKKLVKRVGKKFKSNEKKKKIQRKIRRKKFKKKLLKKK